MKELAIFVDSYDNNKDLWDNFFSIIDYYWPNCCYTKYLVTNTIQYTKHGVKSLCVGDNKDWLNCTLQGLKQLTEKFILFLFEDYYFSKIVSNDQFESIISCMEKENVFFYRLSLINGLNNSKPAVTIPESFPYVINLQPAIWNRAVLIDYLEEMKKTGVSTPWEFEYYFIDKANKKLLPTENTIVKGVLYDTRDIIGYQNAIIQGKWVRGVINKYKGIPELKISTGERKYMAFKDEVWNYIKQLGHLLLPYSKREEIKKVLKVAHFPFMR